MSEILTIKKGIELELEIDSLAYGGMGLAKKDSFVIFVKNAIQGQLVKAFIYKKKNGYAEARYWLLENPCMPRKLNSHYWICRKKFNS